MSARQVLEALDLEERALVYLHMQALGSDQIEVVRETVALQKYIDLCRGHVLEGDVEAFRRVAVEMRVLATCMHLGRISGMGGSLLEES